MLTKEEIAERIRKAQEKRGPKREPINNAEIVEQFRDGGGRILHIRPNARRRGVTIAYVPKGRRVEIATAVTHTNDCFAKKVGTKTAIEHFRDGRTIVLPISEGRTAFDAVERFTWSL
jgi:hypothetical protein